MPDQSPSLKPMTVQEALEHAPRRTPLDKTWMAILSVFFAFYIADCLIWFMDECPFKEAVVPYTHPPMIAFGWTQYWSLFCPEVRNVIYHETAVVTFQDGSTRLYEFPRFDLMSEREHFKREKLRKMFLDNMPWPGYEQFLPVFGRYIARANDNPDSRPVQVTFVHNICNIPEPTFDMSKWTYRDRLPHHTVKDVKFVFQVRKPDLDESPSEESALTP